MKTDAIIEFRGDALADLMHAVTSAGYCVRVGVDMGDVKLKTDEQSWTPPLRDGATTRPFSDEPTPYVIAETSDGTWTGTVHELARALGHEHHAGESELADSRFTIVHPQHGVLPAILTLRGAKVDDDDLTTIRVRITGVHPLTGATHGETTTYQLDGRA